MTEAEPSAQLNEAFSEPGATAPAWSELSGVLSAAESITSSRPALPLVKVCAGLRGHCKIVMSLHKPG